MVEKRIARLEERVSENNAQVRELRVSLDSMGAKISEVCTCIQGLQCTMAESAVTTQKMREELAGYRTVRKFLVWATGLGISVAGLALGIYRHLKGS